MKACQAISSRVKKMDEYIGFKVGMRVPTR